MTTERSALSLLSDAQIEQNDFLVTSEGLNEIGSLKLAIVAQRLIAVLMMKLLNKTNGRTSFRQKLLDQTLLLSTSLLHVISEFRLLLNSDLDSTDTQTTILLEQTLRLQFQSMNVPESLRVPEGPRTFLRM